MRKVKEGRGSDICTQPPPSGLRLTNIRLRNLLRSVFYPTDFLIVSWVQSKSCIVSSQIKWLLDVVTSSKKIFKCNKWNSKISSVFCNRLTLLELVWFGELHWNYLLLFSVQLFDASGMFFALHCPWWSIYIYFTFVCSKY